MTWMRRQLNSDEGFTLIELMVVVLIIAILIAIAIPTFLGARERAQDRAAQSDLRNALTAEKVYYVDEEKYTANTTSLSGIEPSLTFAATGTTTAVGVVVSGTGDSVVTLNKGSASGTYFCISDDLSSGTTYGSGADAAATNTAAECASASW